MNLRSREVRQAAGVVHVHMRDDDVPHVISRKAEPIDLVRDGFVVAQDRPDHAARRPYSPRVVAVTGAIATVDHNQPVEEHGPTALWNLDRLCLHHHQHKHRYGLRLVGPPGRMRFVSPPEWVARC